MSNMQVITIILFNIELIKSPSFMKFVNIF